MGAQSELDWLPRYASRASRMQASEIRELLKLLERPGIISFAGGIPDSDLFPVDEVHTAYDAILSDPARAGRALQYSVSEGDPGLREWIVQRMRGRGVRCDVENILITSGSQQALEFAGRLFLSPNDTALVTAPTYLGALQAFSGNEPVYDTLRFDAAGNRDAQSYSEAAADAGGAVKFAYAVPDFANPSGETLDLAAREGLLKLAEQLDCVVIEDSPYSALRYDGEAVAPLLALDIERKGSIERSRVVHCGSFSKVFTPGLRVGWVCAAREIVSRLTLIKQASDLNCPAINQTVMRHLAQTLFDAQVEKACASYRVKRDAMLRALDKHMPRGVSWSRPEGGMFIWMTLPGETDTAELFKHALDDANVAFVPGHAFHADGSGRNTLRLSFSLPEPVDIEQGIVRLAGVMKANMLPT
jgi:DNA-binding transcriptional MocR family regulator